MRTMVAVAMMIVVAAAAAAVSGAPPVVPGWTVSSTPAAVVSTTSGSVRGVRYTNDVTGAGVTAYLGIPYAQQPVGALRWAAPEAAVAADGVLDASSFGKSCLQESTVVPESEQSEACLFVNVWVPDAADEAPVPVLHWIYGGSFTSGSTSYPAYNGLRLAAGGADGKQPVVFVSANYRLGPFGFLALEETLAEAKTTGNYGLMDQSLAMKWAADNVAAFGGLAANITLMGESAGAISVCYHVALESGTGLFTRAIMESPDCNDIAPLAQALALGDKFTKATGCESAPAGAARLACLRAVPASDVLTAVPLAPLGSQNGASYSPVLDGTYLTGPPNAYLAKSVDADTPVILGTNHESCTLFVMPVEQSRNMSAADLDAGVTALWGPLADRILAMYPLSQYPLVPPASAWAAILSDYIFICPTRTAAGLLTAGGAPTFLYDFQYIPECTQFPPALRDYLGAAHFFEVPYVFGNEPINPGAPCSWAPAGRNISAAFMQTWLAYAHGLLPSDLGWPAYNTKTRPALLIDAPSSIEHDYRGAVCEFWNSIPPPGAFAGDRVAHRAFVKRVAGIA